MRKFLHASLLWLVTCFALTLGPRPGLAAEQRFALVIGNSQYKTGTLATPANDAGLLADALQAAGFTVTGARDLDQATLRESFREFIDQVSAAGPDAVALIYLSGYGVQFAGDNYFVPVDADIQHDVDVPLQAIRISDFTQPLASLPGRVKIVILDAARQNTFAQGGQQGGQPLAGGLALVDPAPSMAIAFNAAPGTVAPDEQGPYGAYATALTEMIGTGGLSLDDIFARVRLRVSEQTQGAEVPWYASQIDGPFFMTERTADAPPPQNAVPLADIRNRPLRDFGNPDDAYAAALALDTIDGYEQFLVAYPNSSYLRRVAAMVAVRHEEITWRHCVMNDTPPAYWSYLRRYPNGPHIWDARRRLAMLRAEMEPPPDFAVFDFGVPPPPPYEMGYVDQPVIMFGGLGFLPPPPPPIFFLPERRREFDRLPPPPPPRERFTLPIPAATAINVFVRPPQTVVIRQAPAGAPTGPGGRPQFHVSLPAAAARATSGAGGTPSVPGALSAPSAPSALSAPSAPGAPGALSAPSASGTPGTRPGFGAPAAVNSPGTPPHPGTVAPAPPPSNAMVKPEPALPHPTAPAPAFEKPATPPPHPAAPIPAFEKPATPPPHPAAPTPAFEKPASPPPHPTAPTPAFEKPAAPPPHPAGPPPAIEKPVAPPLRPAPAMVKPPPPPPPHPAPAAATPAPPPQKPVPPHPAGDCPAGKTATPSGCK
jgi:uncharacterized caspase-like protein